MKKLFLALLLIPFWPSSSRAQGYPANYELLCPSGSIPVSGPTGTSFNQTTGKYRANICIDPFGNISENISGTETFTGTANTFNVLEGCQHVNANQTFAQALAVGGVTCITIDPGTFPVSVNATVPTTVGLAFTKGGILSIATGVTLTVNSPIYASPDAAIFTYVGTGVAVLGGANAVVSSAWFPGADIGIQINNALLALQNGGGNAGGWVDARHYTAAQTSSTNAFAGITIPFTLYLPCTSTTLSVPWIHQGAQQFVEGCINGNPSEIIASSSWPSITLTSQSQTLTTVTAVTASAHPFATHNLVCISGTTDRPTEGCVFVTGSADNTHFTWTNNFSGTRSSTGGIVSQPLVGVGTDASGAVARVRWSRVNFNCNAKCGTVFANLGGEEGSGLDTWVSTNFLGYGIFQCGSASSVNFSGFAGNNKYSTGHVLYNSGSNNTTGFSAFQCGTGNRTTLENTSLVSNGSAGTGNVNIYVSGSNILIVGDHLESAAIGILVDRTSLIDIHGLGLSSSVGTTLSADANGNNITADIVPSGSTAAIVNNAAFGGARTLTGTITEYRATSNGAETWKKDDATHTFNVNGVLGLGSTIQNIAQTATMGLTLKKGSGAGNYTTASTTYAVVDSTNLCNTVTIPTGWKLAVTVSGAIGTATAAVLDNFALTDNAACSTANAGILVEGVSTTTAAGVLQPFALNWVITGDGNSHNIALQFKTSAGADSATILNSSATSLPTMTFTLMPSN